MDWKNYRSSQNVDDRRAQDPGAYNGGLGFGYGTRGASGGFLFGGLLQMLLRFLPWFLFSGSRRQRGVRIGLLLVLGLIVYGFYSFPMAPTQETRSPRVVYAPNTGNGVELAEEEERADFAKKLMAMTEDVWSEIFSEAGLQYEPATLVLYRGYTPSACGMAQSATGPFYCSRDKKIYLDLSFYDEMREKLDAEGDFALAYVLAHEVGHAVQDQLGILDEVHQRMSQLPQAQANRYSVRLELQADYLAGVFAHHVKSLARLTQEDIQEALDAASGVGDDRLQQQAQGYVVPDSFTHGTSAQRVNWFTKGYKLGSVDGANPFVAENLED